MRQPLRKEGIDKEVEDCLNQGFRKRISESRNINEFMEIKIYQMAQLSIQRLFVVCW